MKQIWLIGAGAIAEEYAKILQRLSRDFVVIGRGKASALTFQEHVGISVIQGGLDRFLESNPVAADHAIIATPLSELSRNTLQLIQYGVKNILCEKPGFLYPDELNEVVNICNATKAKVFYAYNRRFFSSVQKAQQIIDEDGGVKSFNFEFTEWGHVIEKSGNSPKALENWFYANSSHVVDLAFFLGGEPKFLNCVTSGELTWHKPAMFAGCGITYNGAVFNYSANWAAPGRWGVEVLTSKHRLYLRPMEQLQVQNIGSVAISPVDIDDHLDKDFKPGFYLETKAFLDDVTSKLCSIKEQAKHTTLIYNKIINS